MNRILQNLLVAAPALALAVPAFPHDPPAGPRVPGPSSVFPADTYAVLEFAGLEACRGAAGRLGLVDFLKGAAQGYYGKSAVAQYAPQILPELDRELGRLGLSRADLLPILRAPIAVGASRMTFFDDDPMPALAVVFRADGDCEAPARRLCDLFIEVMMEEAPRAEQTRFEAGGGAFRVVRSGRSNGAVAAGVVGGFAVIASNPEFAADIAETAAGQAKRFVDVAELAGDATGDGDQLLRLRINTGRMWDALEMVMPYEGDPILGALGIDRVRGVDGSLIALPNGGEDRLSIGVDHSDSGLVGRLLPQPATVASARWFPSSTLLYATTSCQAREVVGAIDRLIDALPTEARIEIRDELENEMVEELRREGIPLRALKDAAFGIGPELAFAIEPPLQGSVLPTVYAAVQLRRPGGAGWLAQRLVDLGVEPRAQDFEGRTLHYVSIEIDGPTIAPAFTEVDGMLLVASTLPALKGALKNGAGDDNLAAQSDFKATLQRHAGAAAVAVMRVEANAATYWEAYGRMVENLVDGAPPELGLSGDMLPTSEELRDMLRDTVLSITRNSGGITFRSEGTLTLGSVLATLGAYADEFLAHDTAGARDN